MNLRGRSDNILGNFNRVGYGFIDSVTGNWVYSIGIYVRSLQAAIVDGTETIVEPSILAHQIELGLTEFRAQHGLPPLNMDADLCQVAEEYSEYIANGQTGVNPLICELFVNEIQKKYVKTDISHAQCVEISRAPQVFMAKWRNNPECISVVLNQIDDVGVGICFDRHYKCHATVIVGALGKAVELASLIYEF